LGSDLSGIKAPIADGKDSDLECQEQLTMQI
jgi:hypothetical protein